MYHFFRFFFFVAYNLTSLIDCCLDFDFTYKEKNSFVIILKKFYNVKVDTFVCLSNSTIELRQQFIYLFISSPYEILFLGRLQNPWIRDKALIQ